MNCFDEQFMNTVHELAWWTIDECSWMFMNIHQRSSLDELHLTGASMGRTIPMKSVSATLRVLVYTLICHEKKAHVYFSVKQNLTWLWKKT